MYKALIDIGDYKHGDEVPAKIAEIWLKMYVNPPVEKVEGKTSIVKPLVKETIKESVNPLLDDYLARNESVVKKNLKKDNIPVKDILSLIKIEKDNKNRKGIIKLLNKKL